MSIFDTDNFLGSSAGGTMSTERELIPANTYSDCSIADLKMSHGTIGKGERAGDPWAMLTIIWEIHDQEVKDKLDRSTVKVSQRVMLDLTADGELDTGRGKNFRLGKLKHTLGLNSGETKWIDFIGKRAVISVTHGVNEKDGTPTEEVSGVAGH